MAVALKEGRPVRGIEAIAERPDGKRVRFLPYPTPLHDGAGRLSGAINLLVETTDKYRTEMESARLAAIVASSDDAIISKTLEGKITSWNAGATRIFGYGESEMIGQHITRIIPPELHEEEHQILARLHRGDHIDHYETVRVAKDGRRIEISLTVSPLRDRLGRVIGASKVARDISERKNAEKLQRLLLDELSHRVKNTLATIQAIASQSLHRAKRPTDFVAGFSGRIQSLARAHDLLTQTNFEGAELRDLVREQVLLGGTDDSRIACSGPRLMVDPQLGMHMALVLHELATNARKYGALSVSSGRLSIQWEIRTDGDRALFLEWRERGVPQLTVPTNRGFGSSLIERTLEAHGGKASMRYGTQGLSVRAWLPLPEKVLRPAASATPPQSDAKSLFAAPGDRTNLKGKRMILIEDEPLVSMDLESILAAAGGDVVGAAGTLATARALSTNAACDAALVDVNLGGQSVEEVAAILTKRNIPFAFVTGYGRESLPEGFREAHVLKKPFSQDDLLAVAELLVRQAPGVVQLRRKKS